LRDVGTCFVDVWTRPESNAVTSIDIWTSSALDRTACWLHTTSTIDVWVRTIDVLASSELFAERHGLFRASSELWLLSRRDIRTSSELDRTACWLHTTSTIDVWARTIDVLASTERFSPRQQLFVASRQLRPLPPGNIATRPLAM
jgi:hypothetical protein